MKKAMKEVEVDIQYLQNLHNHHNDLLFSLERIKSGKVEKLICSIKLNILFI